MRKIITNLQNKLLIKAILNIILCFLVITTGFFSSFCAHAQNSNPQTSNASLLFLLLNDEKEIMVGDLSRRYIDYIPSSIPDNSPVVLVFHGSGSRASDFRKTMGPTLERMADEKKFILVYMSGYEGHFNDCRKKATYSAKLKNIDDIAFTKAILNKLKAERNIKNSKIFALGYSNGGQMTYRLALEAPELVTGIIAISANVPAPENMDCFVNEAYEPYVAIIQGTNDPINPTMGGDVNIGGKASRGKVLSTKESAEWFVSRYGIEESPESANISQKRNLSARKQVWKGKSSKIVLILLEGAGHTIPQEYFPFSIALGPTYQDNSILEYTWDFLNKEEKKVEAPIESEPSK
jgi:polyhydroxybutyrate depolymerase